MAKVLDFRAARKAYYRDLARKAGDPVRRFYLNEEAEMLPPLCEVFEFADEDGEILALFELESDYDEAS